MLGRSVSLVCALALPLPLAAQGLQWQLQNPATLPPPSGGHGLLADAERDELILLQAGLGTWRYTDATGWSPIATPTLPPACLTFAFYVANDGRRLAVLGGTASVSVALWEWLGTDWAARAGGPVPNQIQAAAYDAQRDRLVVFDVRASSLGIWEYGPSGWTDRGAVAIALRFFPAVTWRPGVGVVLHGGMLLTTGFGFRDTWTWNGTSATQIATAGPLGYFRHSMCWFAARSELLMLDLTGQLWRFDDASSQWVQHGPAPLSSHDVLSPLAYDARHDRVARFGGGYYFPPVNDLRFLESVTPALALEYGNACTGTGAASRLSAAPEQRPWIGTTMQATLTAPAGSAALVFGGIDTAQWNGHPLPLSLAAAGAPGCSLLVAPISVLPVTATNGAATVALAVPPAAALIGATEHLQAMVLAPTVNAFGAVFTNALQLTAGMR